MEESTLNIINQPFEILVLRVANKQMTISVFNQLYEEKPFDDNFDLIGDLWGKVNRSDSYVVFKSERGIRKFNLADFKRKLVPNNFSASIRKVFDAKNTSFELDHMRNELINFYHEKNDYKGMLHSVIEKITGDFSPRINDSDAEVLVGELSGDFKNRILDEFERGLKRLENRNKLVDVFTGLPQLFIAV